MKASVFQLIASGIALGLMAGAVGFHRLHLEAGIQEPIMKGEQGGDSLAVGHVMPASISCSEGAVDVSAGSSQRESLRPASKGLEGTVAALTEIVAILRDLREENRELREQVKELNYDLTQVQFQLDTTARSFRPLKIAEDSRNPPIESNFHPLLPPKRP